MPYCPTCKQSFHDATECPVDHVALVGELPFQTISGDTTTWVEIASTGSDDEARLLAGFLNGEGIPAQVENVRFSMEPINFGAMGDIRVYVASEFEARAVDLLRQRNAAYDRLDDDSETVVTDEGPATIEDDSQTESENEA